MTCEQESQFRDLIFDSLKVFSLHYEDLGFNDCIRHSIVTTIDKPVYLVHCTIPSQLEGDVCKCLDTCLCQGIIRPSQSLYASQVVIVCKKIRGDSSVHLLLESQFYHGIGCFSTTLNRQSPTICPQ